ncbi:hypothetical protein B0G82_3596 [Paraburkholderia sp. BL17N1]|nr:hypothetical protein B0G82_3596 [Paraburkholderia sp. BL17N1]
MTGPLTLFKRLTIAGMLPARAEVLVEELFEVQKATFRSESASALLSSIGLSRRSLSRPSPAICSIGSGEFMQRAQSIRRGRAYDLNGPTVTTLSSIDHL